MFNIESGQILAGILYRVYGEKGVIYNGVNYSTNDIFRGVYEVTEFVFIGDGTEMLIELTEVKAGSLMFVQGYIDITFPNKYAGIAGMSLSFDLTEAEKVIKEVTILNGMSLELLDITSYSYFINETRFSFNPD